MFQLAVINSVPSHIADEIARDTVARVTRRGEAVDIGDAIVPGLGADSSLRRDRTRGLQTPVDSAVEPLPPRGIADYSRLTPPAATDYERISRRVNGGTSSSSSSVG